MPSRPSMIPVARPWLGEQEAEAARRAILSGWVTQGPEVTAFEREFASFVGAPCACAVSNCTVAIQLALQVAGVGPGDEVITVSHSFIATANAIRHTGAVPVFADIEAGNGYNLDAHRLEELVGPRTKAILCVHQLGMPCDLPAVLSFARAKGLRVIEDAACAIGSEIAWRDEWQRIGRPHGDVACFSFHPRKLLTTGDGGMLTTADAEWDQRFRTLRHQGMSVSDVARDGSDTVIFERYSEIGYNFRMTDIQAAVGRVQLGRLPEALVRRKAQVDRYRRLLACVPGLGLPTEPAWARSNWQSFCVRLPAGVEQRRFMQTALDAGVATRRGVMCAHREQAYLREAWACTRGERTCDCPAGSCRRLAESERAQDGCVVLPLFHEMSDADQDRVADVVRRACVV